MKIFKKDIRISDPVHGIILTTKNSLKSLDNFKGRNFSLYLSKIVFNLVNASKKI